MFLKKHPITIIIIGFSIIAFLCIQFYFKSDSKQYDNSSRVLVKPSPGQKMTTIEERWEFMFNLTRDPKTNTIPKNIRARELAHAKKLQKTSNNLSSAAIYDWAEVGPNDVGGRTRALAIDIIDPNRILAGGTSGGIWESTDNGATWELKSSSTSLLSVTSLVQDPRNGYTNIWYYAAGEWSGNTASARGGGATFRGNGIYKSTDNGKTWNVIATTTSDPTSFDSFYDYVSKIIVNPASGAVFIAVAYYGILMSPDGGTTFYAMQDLASLGWPKSHYSDIVVAGDGTLIASLSQLAYDNPPALPLPGIYRSTDDGFNWENITPAGFPSTHERTVLAISESNPNIVYALTNTGTMDGDNEVITLFKIDYSTSTATDLSANLPTYDGVFSGSGRIDTQSNYNMVISVKPDDENFVLIGGTSLFRSTDGFSIALAKIADAKNDWIGGYQYVEDDDFFYYPNHHPDQHALFFDINDPNKLWSGHDGGLSYTTNITNTSYTDYFPWESKNNGYNVTQFYTVAIDKELGDNKIMGGTQDNGTPHFQVENGAPTPSSNLSGGDGAYAYYGDDFVYISSQNGKIYRSAYDGDGNPINMWLPLPPGQLSQWSEVYPRDASGQLFINPFVIDPNDEDIMYYPAGTTLWRNNALTSIPNYETPGTLSGWTELSNISVPAGYVISTLNVTTSNPTNVLYYAASSTTAAPKIYKLENANDTTDGEVDVSVPSAVVGAYVHDIAINPEDGSDIIVVMSNYKITGLYHSSDGGLNYTAIEGNLTGTAETPGPSLRSSVIMPFAGNPKISAILAQNNGNNKYLIGTSTGLYSTENLAGNNTVWSQESPTGIGNVVVEKLTARTSDNQIGVATHGRGLWMRPFNSLVGVNSDNEDIFSMQFELEQNYPNPFNPITTINYQLSKQTNVVITIYDISGRKIRELVNDNELPGYKSVVWDSRDDYGQMVSAGVYFYHLKAGEYSKSQKMLLLK